MKFDNKRPEKKLTRYRTEKFPFALSIAGSDCSGGAGVQADLKTFSQLGVYGASAITCVVAEHAKHVGSIINIPPEIISEQITLCCDALPLGAIKTGMLPTPAIIRAVARAVSRSKTPLIVDPVMVASTGTPLISSAAIRLLRTELLPLATLITPNLHEASILLDGQEISHRNIIESAQKMAKTYSCAVLLKGGHLPGKMCRDVLVLGEEHYLYESERITGRNTHGSGCTLSAAITAYLSKRLDLQTACARAKQFFNTCILNAVPTRVGRLLNHQHTTL